MAGRRPVIQTELFKAPKDSNNLVPPIVGVAVGKSNSEVKTTSGTFHKVNFGPLTVDITTPDACPLSIQLRQLSWADVEARLADAESAAGTSPPINYSRVPANGGESWIDAVNVDGDEEDCGMSATSRAIAGLSQFNNGFVNKAVVKCDFDPLDCAAGTHGTSLTPTPSTPGTATPRMAGPSCSRRR